MAVTKVYDLDGKEHEMESIDARECAAEMGWSLIAPKPAEEEKPKPGRPKKEVD
jgi:hypothetical protein